MEEPAALLRETSDAAQARDWSLVLASAGIAHTLREQAGHYALSVEAADAEAAVRSLEAYDAESRAPPEAATFPDGRSALGLAAAVLLAAFCVVAGTREAPDPLGHGLLRPHDWFGAGSAISDRILAGQWWRAVTALTLHADLVHLLGNVVACLIFVSAVGRWLGSGLGAALTLAAGAGGNLLTAAAHGPGHASVGASTATFAALGIMAGLQAVRRLRHGPLRRRAWLPLGAGLALFAVLGVGERSDVLAHLFGLGLGAVTGVAASFLRQRTDEGAIASGGARLRRAQPIAGVRDPPRVPGKD